MNLLLTNDDGYQSRGLKTLAKVLSAKHNVYIMAPASNRSAVSHCINMSKPLEIVKIEENVYTCSGFPVDCVVDGVYGGIFPKIDAVISGINYGANIGTDIIYSGTCAAARQASLYKLPAIAVSVEHEKGYGAVESDFNFQPLSEFVFENLEKLCSMAHTEHPLSFVNVNAMSADSYKGMKIATEIAVRKYGDSVNLEKTDKGYIAHFIPGQSETVGSENCDYRIAKDGYVAVSVVVSEPVSGV